MEYNVKLREPTKGRDKNTIFVAPGIKDNLFICSEASRRAEAHFPGTGHETPGACSSAERDTALAVGEPGQQATGASASQRPRGGSAHRVPPLGPHRCLAREQGKNHTHGNPQLSRGLLCAEPPPRNCVPLSTLIPASFCLIFPFSSGVPGHVAFSRATLRDGVSVLIEQLT